MSGVTGSARGNVGSSPEDPKLAKLEEEEEEEEEETAGVVTEAEIQAGTDRPAIVRAATLEEDTLEPRKQRRQSLALLFFLLFRGLPDQFLPGE